MCCEFVLNRIELYCEPVRVTRCSSHRCASTKARSTSGERGGPDAGDVVQAAGARVVPPRPRRSVPGARRLGHARQAARKGLSVHVRLQLGQPRRDDGPQAAHLVRQERRALRDGVLPAHGGRQKRRAPREEGAEAAPARVGPVPRLGREKVSGHHAPQVLQHQQLVGRPRGA